VFAYDASLVTIVVFTVVGCAISLPLIYGKVPRNRYYGFRTRKTLADDATWYAANAYFAKLLVAGSLVAAAIALAIYLWRGLSPEDCMNVTIVLLVAPSLLAVILTLRFVARAR
jgi:uncharacterized membrane protein